MSSSFPTARLNLLSIYPGLQRQKEDGFVRLLTQESLRNSTGRIYNTRQHCIASQIVVTVPRTKTLVFLYYRLQVSKIKAASSFHQTNYTAKQIYHFTMCLRKLVRYKHCKCTSSKLVPCENKEVLKCIPKPENSIEREDCPNHPPSPPGDSCLREYLRTL